jgi:hypothetical protein
MTDLSSICSGLAGSRSEDGAGFIVKPQASLRDANRCGNAVQGLKPLAKSMDRSAIKNYNIALRIVSRILISVILSGSSPTFRHRGAMEWI